MQGYVDAVFLPSASCCICRGGFDLIHLEKISFLSSFFSTSRDGTLVVDRHHAVKFGHKKNEHDAD